jgi:hypothetical protein
VRDEAEARAWAAVVAKARALCASATGSGEAKHCEDADKEEERGCLAALQGPMEPRSREVREAAGNRVR